MKATKSILALVLGVLLSSPLLSCHPAVSVRPLDTDADAETVEPRIEGDWESPDFDEIGTEKEIMLRWHIEPNQWGGGYHVEMQPRRDDESKPEGWGATRYDVKLVPLDGKLFFDAQFDEEKFGQDTRDASGLPPGVAPLHLIGRIWVEKDFLRIVLLHSSWVDDNAPETLPRVSISMPGKYDENLVVITPSTEELRKFVVQHADTPDAFSYDTYLCRPGADCAARAVEDGLSRKPNDAETLDEAGELYMKRGNYTRAADLWRRLAEIEPARALWREDVGEALLFLRDYEGARREFATAQKLEPERTHPRRLMAWSYFLEGKFDEAAKVLEAHVASDPSPAADEILLTYFVLRRLGRQEEAQAMLKEQTASFRGNSSDDHLLLLAFDGRLDSWWPPSEGLAGQRGRFFQAQKALLGKETKWAADRIQWATDRLNEILKAGRNDDLWTLAARIELERLPTKPVDKPGPKNR